MNLYCLFPSVFRKIGWTLFVLAGAAGVYSGFMASEPLKIGGMIVGENFFPTVLLLSLFLVFFAKEKKGQPFLSELRVQAILEACFINGCLVFIGFLILGRHWDWDLLLVLYANTISFFIIYFIIFYIRKFFKRK